jgi:hypothetical protein
VRDDYFLLPRVAEQGRRAAEVIRIWVFCERPDSPLAEVTGTAGSSIATVNKLYSDVCDISGVGEAGRKPVFGVFRDFLKLKLSSA